MADHAHAVSKAGTAHLAIRPQPLAGPQHPPWPSTMGTRLLLLLLLLPPQPAQALRCHECFSTKGTRLRPTSCGASARCCPTTLNSECGRGPGGYCRATRAKSAGPGGRAAPCAGQLWAPGRCPPSKRDRGCASTEGLGAVAAAEPDRPAPGARAPVLWEVDTAVGQEGAGGRRLDLATGPPGQGTKVVKSCAYSCPGINESLASSWASCCNADLCNSAGRRGAGWALLLPPLLGLAAARLHSVAGLRPRRRPWSAGPEARSIRAGTQEPGHTGHRTAGTPRPHTQTCGAGPRRHLPAPEPHSSEARPRAHRGAAAPGQRGLAPAVDARPGQGSGSWRLL
ncbi:hypothetical protein J0S82_019163 [Galemys pyrenaicus]|uniref:Snake toxin/toxin-like domain-containing protein n=1 Tax=Galemys pyrenaicus TaxID=202257 RepID=A0A8J6A9H9_GALPY|nr:hypothetical protein J0S82_019163 [Galemys pyrenaicus]